MFHPATAAERVDPGTEGGARWYQGIRREQWLVLAVASAGWIFDVFEGQIFVASMNRAMGDLLGPAATPQTKEFTTNVALAAFLLGGASGGLLFGVLADRIGRRRTMTLTILTYSLFTGVTYFAQHWWDLAALRFLVAMGVGGEWAVAAAAVAEVFPARARPAALGIFHASSVLGTYLAVLAGATVVVAGWRYGFLLGLAPALLIVWVRTSMPEPQEWERTRAEARSTGLKMGDLAELFRNRQLRRNLMVGTALAAVGMGVFWGVHVHGKDLVREAIAGDYLRAAPGALADPALRRAVLERHGDVLQRWEMLGMFLVTTGGGLGLLAFAPITARLGRRRAFAAYLIGGLAATLVTFLGAHELTTILALLPVFGFLTVGMHAGYAIYFPELFPTRLRGSGGGFCFNIGRVFAVPALLLTGALQTLNLGRGDGWGVLGRLEAFGLVASDATGTHPTLRAAVASMTLLFLVGLVVLVWAPETGAERRQA